MNITYRNIDFGSEADCALLAKWANDPEIRHLATLYKDEASFATLSSPERFKERGNDPNKNRADIMILLNDIPIGEMSFELYPESDSNPVLSVAWFSIVIGEAHARGKGLGRIAMTQTGDLAVAGMLLGNQDSDTVRVYARRDPTALVKVAETAWQGASKPQPPAPESVAVSS